MKQFKIFIVFILCLTIFSCEKKMSEQEVVGIGQFKSKKLAPYTKMAGFDSRQIALSTNELNITGLLMHY